MIRCVINKAERWANRAEGAAAMPRALEDAVAREASVGWDPESPSEDGSPTPKLRLTKGSVRCRGCCCNALLSCNKETTSGRVLRDADETLG